MPNVLQPENFILALKGIVGAGLIDNMNEAVIKPFLPKFEEWCDELESNPNHLTLINNVDKTEYISSIISYINNLTPEKVNIDE